MPPSWWLWVPPSPSVSPLSPHPIGVWHGGQKGATAAGDDVPHELGLRLDAGGDVDLVALRTTWGDTHGGDMSINPSLSPWNVSWGTRTPWGHREHLGDSVKTPGHTKGHQGTPQGAVPKFSMLDRGHMVGHMHSLGDQGHFRGQGHLRDTVGTTAKEGTPLWPSPSPPTPMGTKATWAGPNSMGDKDT